MRELDIGSEFAGHRIKALVGRGGVALVYRAIQLELDRPVALKLIAPRLADDHEFRGGRARVPRRFRPVEGHGGDRRKRERDSDVAKLFAHLNDPPPSVTELLTPRDHLAAASDGRFVYAVGGRELAADRNLDSVERYDSAADRWTQLPPLPTPRGGLGAAIVGRRLVAVGGEGPTSVFATAESFDLASGKWSRIADLRTPRHGLGVAAIGSTLYALGGALEPGHLTSSTVAESIAFEPSEQP